ncbi:MAG: 6,7-dimethyl-8-ribityllumazine synthase [Mesorhizobium sp.]|uniref:6,7-dimethyl-8-ribityllumazine synthase n=1 Tax=unclassified Mesorhizobium TaxID=325217 RepID=UPI0007FE259B|nr:MULTISPECIES: 6,7-dimethyl-8-ribityllumazine synthase [unclassified Mesorhizobium]TGV92480.1 6,7-dimethyl-8-ribityllumazine synthase [Mesorhizobium sp. M00.F.Ca.ET.158.01.1.1]WIE89804.1 6,7-dimethyl-8-ribityllumazine synthase [Mesorhizobium sp. WSM4875]AZO58100.1 6,7-dimethyl-8-ribityllumazine synthase [Mesorhizobium sp. M1A.F.Ca.IN.022.06.1.1]MCT2578328.1 6,7-dimethyl-8-ribityllumazine synthase [Mesorhizobium sp. P13.3]MDF3167657.1 6,7-dimethyl-8-ribityllumazine synthase [Mesorhizobium sp.
MAGISQHGKAFIRPQAKAHLLIVEARFHDDLADALLEGATSALDEAGATYDVVTVPGSLEIPAVITFALDGAGEGGVHYDGFVALGTIIRGDTYHFDIVANESSRALMDLSVQEAVAIGNGILTTENDAQAWTRAKRTEGDKGGFAARAALTMIALKEKFGAQS